MRSTLLFLAVASALRAQTFEVASIKPRDPARSATGCVGGPGSPTPTRFVCGSAAITELVSVAYNVKWFAIAGPDWARYNTEGFDIEATMPAGATRPQFEAMVRNLLAERFHLKMHREDRPTDGYTLTASKPSLKPSSPTATREFNIEQGQVMRAHLRKFTLAALAEFLEVILQAPVTNDTNLAGDFDFDLEFIQPRLLNSQVQGPSLFSALQESAGLTLRAAKRPLSFVVIDSVDRKPTAN